MKNPISKLHNIVNGGLRKAKLRFMGSNLDLAVEALRLYNGAVRLNLGTLNPSNVPQRINGFHDLAFLFASHQANRGVIAQDFDEASYLWSVIVSRRPRQILEIGRWLGGSTVLFSAAAATYGGNVSSVDLKLKAPAYADDKLIVELLSRLQL